MSGLDRTESYPSTEILIAEHERLSSLFLYNAELGEKRAGAYLTLISVAVAGMLGISQLQLEAVVLVELLLGVLGGVFLLGFVTFVRMVERRARSVEYLRAINRIHAYFVARDPSLAQYFSWPPCDDVPRFRAHISDVSGLRDIIAILNSLFFGVTFALLIYLFAGPSSIAVALAVVIGLFAGVTLLVVEFWVESVTLARAERIAQPLVRFPSPAETRDVG